MSRPIDRGLSSAAAWFNSRRRGSESSVIFERINKETDVERKRVESSFSHILNTNTNAGVLNSSTNAGAKS